MQDSQNHLHRCHCGIVCNYSRLLPGHISSQTPSGTYRTTSWRLVCCHSSSPVRHWSFRHKTAQANKTSIGSNQPASWDMNRHCWRTDRESTFLPDTDNGLSSSKKTAPNYRHYQRISRNQYTARILPMQCMSLRGIFCTAYFPCRWQSGAEGTHCKKVRCLNLKTTLASTCRRWSRFLWPYRRVTGQISHNSLVGQVCTY